MTNENKCNAYELFLKVGYPAGFTRTEYYLDWIKEQAGIN